MWMQLEKEWTNSWDFAAIQVSPPEVEQASHCTEWAFRSLKLNRAKVVWRESYRNTHMEVSWNRGTPKSSILMGFSLINHPGNPAIGVAPWLWKPPYSPWNQSSDTILLQKCVEIWRMSMSVVGFWSQHVSKRLFLQRSFTDAFEGLNPPRPECTKLPHTLSYTYGSGS